MTDAEAVRRELGKQLVQHAGGYLRNTVRAPLETCSVCTTPVDGYPLCYKCNGDRQIGIADLVVPLAYGISGMQSGKMLRHYKDDYSKEVRDSHTSIIGKALFLGIALHQKCIARTVGLDIGVRLTIPSLKGRDGIHPFEKIASDMNAVHAAPHLVASAGATSARDVDGTKFQLDLPSQVAGQHVLLLDDTWTTGSRTQSAALAVRAAGATAVSVLVVGRWLEPNFGHNRKFIREKLTDDYDPWLCPVTGGACP